jgi:hypothetical protein
VRVLDLLFLLHDAESGELVVLDYQGQELGAIVGALLGFEFEGLEPTAPAQSGAEGQHAFGLTREQIEQLAGGIEPGEAAAFMLIEHVWARDLKAAVREAGGYPLGEGFLTPEAVAEVALEVAAMAAALDEVEVEQAAGATAYETTGGGDMRPLAAATAASRGSGPARTPRTRSAMRTTRRAVTPGVGVTPGCGLGAPWAWREAPARLLPRDCAYISRTVWGRHESNRRLRTEVV